MTDENGASGSPLQQQTFPQQRVQVLPEGVLVSVLIAPGTGWFTTIDDNTFNTVMQIWEKTHPNIVDQLRLIEHVRQSKNN